MTIAASITPPKGSKPFTLPALALASSAAGEPAAPPDWVMMLPAGLSHTNDGRFFKNYDPEGVIARTKSNGLEIPVDINHGIEIGLSEPSMGWVKDYEVRNGEIWALVEWTDLGREQVLSKHYRYISPAMNHDTDSNVIDFQSVALTNKPALIMPALANTQNNAAASAAQNPQQTETLMDEATLAKFRKIFNLADDADETAVQAAIDAAAEAADETAADEAAKALADKEAADKAASDAVAGAGEAGGDDDVELPENPNPDVFVYKADYDAAVARLEESAADAADAPNEVEISEAVETAMASGRIAPATAAHHKAMCSTRKGLDSFKSMVKIAPQVVPTAKAKTALASSQKKTGGLSENQLATCSRMGIDPKAYAATLKSNS